jgi:hypothetical protein
MNGLVSFSRSINIGDDIQSLSISKLMPSVDLFIDRENISKKVRPCKAVINGWYKHALLDWPPHKNIKPLFISFHLNNLGLLNHIGYLKKHEPIGCRDFYTLNILKKYSVDCYFSGCSTLTLDIENKKIENKVIFVDTPMIDLKINDFETESLDTITKRPLPYNKRLDLATDRLNILSTARCVVTTRLHTALPCVAMNIPVYVVLFYDPKRFDGFLDLFNYSTHLDKNLNNKIIDFIENPSKCSCYDRVISIKNNIKEKIKSFYTDS